MIKSFILLHNILWLFNLNILFMYIFFIKYFKKIRINHLFIQLTIIFICLQIISTSLSIMNDYFDTIRFIGAFHNIFVFSFILIGFSLVYNEKYINIIYEKLVFIIYIVLFSCIASIFLFYYLQTNIEYNFLGHSIVFMSKGYLLDEVFPRLAIFTPYANATAIFIYLLTSIFILSPNYSNYKIITKIIFALVVIIIVIFTGSRIVLLTVFGLFLFSFLKKRLYYFLLLIFMFFFIFYLIEIDFLNTILSSRQGSSDMRMRIYTTSLETMLKTNLYTGIGLKPFVSSIPDLPLGSHSTLIGYYTKNGILIGTLYLIFNLYIFMQFIYIFFIFILKKTNHKNFYINYVVLSILIIYLFEDLDSYEINSLLTGIVLGIYFKNKRKNVTI